jgi:hypothetical protein
VLTVWEWGALNIIVFPLVAKATRWLQPGKAVRDALDAQLNCR